MKIKKNDIILIGIALLISGIIYIYMGFNKASGAEAVVSLSDGTEQSLSLKKEGIYDFPSNDYTIHIEVKQGKAAFVNSPCPDHICEHYGYLSNEGELAVCLPAKASLSIRK